MKAKDLKNSILQMAVEGKLVPQNPDDEPASVLLERIREEKHRLIAEGKAKFPKGGESIIYIGSDGSPYEKRMDAKGRVLSDEYIADEVPFEELPEGWAWARLSSLFTKIGSGSTPAGGRKVYQDEGPMLIRSQNVHNDGLRLDDVAHFSRSLFESRNSHVLPNDVLLNITGASIGRCAIVPDAFGNADVNQHVLIMRPVNDALNEYLHVAIISPVVQIAIMIDQVGATKEGLSAAKAANLLVPIPPLAEQHRIVERVSELIPLVEGYGKLEDAREKLDASLPGRLRKSVLQMAVQGRLVPQDPDDEPASKLLERIRGQRRKLVAEKKMKAPKGGESVIFIGSDGRRYEKRIDAKGRESEPVCIEDEIPFEMPDGWEWARLGSLCDFGKCQNVEYECVAEGMWNLDLEDIEKDTGVVIRKKRKTNDESGSTKHAFISGAVLYSKLRPYLNKVVVADEGGVCSSEILPLNFPEMDNEYAQLILMEPNFVEYAKECSYGVKMPRLGTDDGKRWLVAVPPLAEQHRIVAAFKTYMINAL